MSQVPLRKVIAQFTNMSDKDHEFARLYNIAVMGFEDEFNMDVQGNIVTVLLDVNDNKTVELPAGYLNYSKIGAVNQIGEFVTLKRNDQLSKYHAAYYQEANRNAGVPTIQGFGTPINAFNGGYNNLYYYNFWAYGTSFNLYGLDSGTATVGTYSVDVTDNVILLNPEFQYSQILLEYLSDGYNEDEEDYMIDSRIVQAVRAWIRWQSSLDMIKKYPANLIALYERQYNSEKKKARRRVNGFNLSEFNDIIRRGNKLVAKA